MNKQYPISLVVMVTLLATAPFLHAQVQQPTEEQLSRILKRFPEADKDKDGTLSTEEIEAVRQMFQSRQRNRRSAGASEPTQAGDAKLAETLADMNARFKNVEVELLEWPDELHTNLGKMTKLALMTRPVKKVKGKLPLLINLHGGGPRWFNMSFQQQLVIATEMGMKRGFDLAELAGKVRGGIVLVLNNQAHIANLAVHPDAGGQGAGRALIDQAMAAAAAAGHDRIRLATHAKMTATQEFYRRLGWQETGREGDKVYFQMQLM